MSNETGQSECCLFCQIMKARVGIVVVSYYEGQGGCFLCKIIKARVSVVCCVI